LTTFDHVSISELHARDLSQWKQSSCYQVGGNIDFQKETETNVSKDENKPTKKKKNRM